MFLRSVGNIFLTFEVKNDESFFLWPHVIRYVLVNVTGTGNNTLFLSAYILNNFFYFRPVVSHTVEYWFLTIGPGKCFIQEIIDVQKPKLLFLTAQTQYVVEKENYRNGAFALTQTVF